MAVGNMGLQLFENRLVRHHHAQETAGTLELNSFGHECLSRTFFGESEFVSPMTEGTTALRQNDPLIFIQIDDFVDQFDPHAEAVD